MTMRGAPEYGQVVGGASPFGLGAWVEEALTELRAGRR